MRTKMRCYHHLLGPVLIAIGLVAARPSRVEAQAQEEVARAISTIMDHRAAYGADSLPFDGCAIQRAMGGAAEYADRLVHHVRHMVDDQTASCPRSAERGRSVVLVDSVQIGGDTARVYLTVIRGELVHRENYALNPRAGVYMGVREVRSWGFGQAYSGRPR